MPEALCSIYLINYIVGGVFAYFWIIHYSILDNLALYLISKPTLNNLIFQPQIFITLRMILGGGRKKEGKKVSDIPFELEE